MKQIKVELQSVFGNDRQVADAAWTSSIDYQKKKERTEEDVKRIVNMLADLKHSVPFESIIFRFWIKLPIVADRQLMTHRLQSASGMSGRYRTMPNEFLEIPNDIQILIKKTDEEQFHNYEELCVQANEWYHNILKFYKQCEVDNKITNKEYKRLREFFRGVLPQNNMTERVTIMNLRAFCNFIKLRLSEHAQPEIRQIAEMMLQSVKESNVCPIALEALERNNWVI